MKATELTREQLSQMSLEEIIAHERVIMDRISDMEYNKYELLEIGAYKRAMRQSDIIDKWRGYLHFVRKVGGKHWLFGWDKTLKNYLKNKKKK